MVPTIEVDGWCERFGLVAGVTGKGTGEPFDLGLSTSQPAAVTARWRALREAFRPQFRAFQVAHQCHGTEVAWYAGVPEGWHIADDRDGHATADAGLLLCVTIADCVPIYLTRDDGSAFALLHVGWRAAAAGILERGIRLLTSRPTPLEPRRLVAHLGVAICGTCYEVGPEVVEAVEGWRPADRVRFDLRGALSRRAAAAGVRDVSVSPLCTSCDRERFFSHRASGGSDGRQVAFLGRPGG